MRRRRGSLCSIALLLVCLELKSHSFSYRTQLPFDSKVATLPDGVLVGNANDERFGALEHRVRNLRFHIGVWLQRHVGDVIGDCECGFGLC